MPKNGNPYDIFPPDPDPPAMGVMPHDRQFRPVMAPSIYHPDNYRFCVNQLQPMNIQPFTSLDRSPAEAYEQMMVETCVAALIKDFQIALQNHEPCGNGIIDHTPLSLAYANPNLF
jgi:hypothetical protein